MPWTLYRYILRELLKLLLLTTAVLVVVMSFATAVQPMSDGQLTAALLVKFVIFTAPTVLGFALPFAGAFASTLVFIRLAGDNEILACSASGISYVKVLAPVLALGVVLTGGMLYLSNAVVPSFFRLAERTVEGDVIGLLVTQLGQRQFFEFPGEDVVVYADSAAQFPPQEVPGSALPMTQLVELGGVVVGRTDGRGRILEDTTAENAVLMVFSDRDTEDAWGVFELQNVTRYAPTTGVLMRVAWTRVGPLRIPSLFSDDPKFLSASDLDAYEREPERSREIRESIQSLASAMATESLRQAFGAVKDRAVLYGPLQDERYVLSVPRVEEDGELLRMSSGVDADGEAVPIRMSFYADGRVEGQPFRTYTAESAFVRVQTNALTPEPTIDLELLDVQIEDHRGGPTVGSKSLMFRQLAWPEFLPDDLEQRPAAELLAEAELPTYAASATVSSMAGSLDRAVAALRRDIVGQRHERAASAVSCALLLLLGAVLSMKLKGQAPLVVYFWSFMLAIVTLIIISSGVNLAQGADVSVATGMAVVWAGNGLLLLVLVGTYYRLARN
ncbi:MAG: LptF/LptG family permease [Planctomycetota bacterium]